MVLVVMEGRLRRRGLKALSSKGVVLLGALSLFSAATLSLLPGVASASSTTTTTTGTTLYVAPNGSGTSTTCSETVPCSLTHAITLANSTSGDTVMVGAGTYDTGTASTNANLTTGTIVITASMTIVGAGADKTFIGGTSTSDQVAGSVFQIDAVTSYPTVTISGVTVQYGNATNNVGGGISNFGNLTVTNDTISGNSASGAYYSYNAGGIFNNGTLTRSSPLASV